MSVSLLLSDVFLIVCCGGRVQSRTLPPLSTLVFRTVPNATAEAGNLRKLRGLRGVALYGGSGGPDAGERGALRQAAKIS
ncbi:hypothetical protein [Marinibacterium profundimaris]|uniref:hypothetical protein n=1 Tax=Marinibacterium profundimaris TaxID=1679460 RepID=UPI00117DE5D0|nr:hypothetical protein [Marinibacterium profundimaris]